MGICDSAWIDSLSVPTVVSAGISSERRSASACDGAVIVRVIRLRRQDVSYLNTMHVDDKRRKGSTNMMTLTRQPNGC